MYAKRFVISLVVVLPFFAVANENVQDLIDDPNNWAIWGGDYAGTRYSTLNQITRRNVGDLQVAWTFSTGVLRGHEGGPLVVGDTLYIHTPFPNKVFSINLDDQTINWEYVPVQNTDTIPVMCCDTVNRGLAYAEGKIFLQQADTWLVALDSETGEVLWRQRNGDPARGESNTNAPLVVKDKVITGISGGEYGVRGFVVAYDINTGEEAWKAYSVGPDEELLVDPRNTTHLGEPIGTDSSLDTWEGDQWQLGGGTTWGWFTYDPELNLVYYGSGNPGTWNPVSRPGDNRWSMTLFARDVDTGMARWVYQMTPHDEWDYDGVNENVLVDIEIDGEMRKALVHFDRNGFGYTLDRESGELLVAEKFDPAVNWATHVDMDTGRPQVAAEFSTDQNGVDVNTENICPAALGSKDQQPVAYSPRTNLFYVPTNHVCMHYEPYEIEYVAGQPYVGAVVEMFPSGRAIGDGTNHLGNFLAWDAAEGEIVWSNSEPFSVWSGALATAGDVVFYGTLEGYLKAVDATTGEELYSFKTPSGIIGNVNTWVHEGTQYIGVLSGVGGWAGIGMAAGLSESTDGLGAVGAYRSLSQYTQLGGVLTVFALP
ncbi:methanol/ethanol family PQQ-dependent dehydrogenase [Candidatus Rariloculus sp.]|uniref:methanol/ethanol family PQQ-dependent dehydrogenase n=1 Tax=Candidatus Rariloculus sp. TaxID=3101265 RepID=UPI003D152F3C